MPKEKVLIVYYSRSGKTKRVAEELKQKFKADMEELVDIKNRKGILGYIFAGRDAIQGRLTDIKPLRYNPSDYDLIIIGTPTWGSTMSPAVRTYVEKNKANFKRLGFFATAAGNDADKTAKNIEELCKTKSEFILGFSGKDLKNKSYINSIKNLK
jgi:flavodoxin